MRLHGLPHGNPLRYTYSYVGVKIGSRTKVASLTWERWIKYILNEDDIDTTTGTMVMVEREADFCKS